MKSKFINKIVIIFLLIPFTFFAKSQNNETLIAGRIDTNFINTKDFGQQEIQVYLPHNFEITKDIPVLYCLNGEIYFKYVSFIPMLDSLFQFGTNAFVVVSLPSIGWVPEDSLSKKARSLMINEIVAQTEKYYSLSVAKENRWLLGFSSGASLCVDLGINFPNTFDKIALQSPGWMIWDNDLKRISIDYTNDILNILDKKDKNISTKFWFVWGDSTTDQWESRSRENGEKIIRALNKKGGVTIHGGLVNGGHGLHIIKKSFEGALNFLLNL